MSVPGARNVTLDKPDDLTGIEVSKATAAKYIVKHLKLRKSS